MFYMFYFLIVLVRMGVGNRFSARDQFLLQAVFLAFGIHEEENGS